MEDTCPLTSNSPPPPLEGEKISFFLYSEFKNSLLRSRAALHRSGVLRLIQDPVQDKEKA